MKFLWEKVDGENAIVDNSTTIHASPFLQNEFVKKPKSVVFCKDYQYSTGFDNLQ